ncbi:MAG: DUF3108 domain-containing protein, partial [Cytophagales bacterium]
MTVVFPQEFKAAVFCNLFIFILVNLILSACGGKSEHKKEDFVPTLETIDYQKNYFKEAEHFEYSVKYGFMKGGFVNIDVDTALHVKKDRVCYIVEIVGEAVGLADRINDFKDVFTSYVDTTNYLPVVFKRDIKENKFVKKDATFFNRETLEAICVEKNTQNPDSIKITKISENMQDIISAYFLLRNLDLNRKKVGDTIIVDVFFDNEAFNLKMKIMKRDKIRSRLGERNCLLIAPIIPDNPLLRTETPIVAWISDDEDRIPLRLKVL